MNWDKVYRQNYENKAFSSGQWLASARSLLHSARILEPKITELWENYRAHSKDQSILLLPDHFQGPFFMLLAFATENLFKAAIVKENSAIFLQQFKTDKKFPKQLQTHTLVELAKLANFKFNTQEEDLLRRLTRHAIWAGRYPVPLKYHDSSGIENFEDGKEYLVSWFAGNDLERLKALIECINEQLGLEIT